MVEIEHLLVIQHFRVVYCRPENISDKWGIPQLYHEKGLHSYLSTFSLAAVKLSDNDI